MGREGRFSEDVAVKWCGPVGVALPNALAGDRRKRVLEALESLSRLTAVDFRLGAEPGIDIHYPLLWEERKAVTASLPVATPADRRRLDSARCFFVIQAERTGGCLIKADVVIPADLDEADFGHCVAEELSQAMGLPNDIDAGAGSVFSRSGRAPGRTPADDLFLRVLYDPALKPGSTRPDLEAAVPGLIRKHR